MKKSSHSPARVLQAGIVAAVCFVAIPQYADAKDRNDHNQRGGRDSGHHDNDDRGGRDDDDRRAYISHPRSNFTLSFGTGYAGRGYYYGPPRASYYYQRADVQYYANREAASRQHYVGNSTGAAVQRELSRRGYYDGPIDGTIGQHSRRAISRYQRDNGLAQTGSINQTLLRSLRLY